MEPTTDQAKRFLADSVLSVKLPDELIQERVRQIHEHTLTHSRYIREPDFNAIHPRDLESLFNAYDEWFLGGHCRRALEGRRLDFRLSRRMTKAGGKTTRFAATSGELSYEIAIAVSMLFDAFKGTDRSVSVCGLECANRLEALQRIFEHELVHLIELVCWGASDCAVPRFQSIAAGFFLHRAHTHNLITRRERAARTGIHVGSPVSFIFEGSRLAGRVNRITKRATVLVEHPAGMKYSDGLRYKAYYVPLACLRPRD